MQLNLSFQLPTVSAPTNVNLGRGVPTTISIYAYDDDTPEWFDFIVLSFAAPYGGNFSYIGTVLDNSSFPIILAHSITFPPLLVLNHFS